MLLVKRKKNFQNETALRSNVGIMEPPLHTHIHSTWCFSSRRVPSHTRTPRGSSEIQAQGWEGERGGGSWASQKQLAEEDSLKWVGRCVPKAPQSWQPWLPAAVGCAQNKHKWMDEFRLESHLASRASGTTLGDSPAS